MSDATPRRGLALPVLLVLGLLGLLGGCARAQDEPEAAAGLPKFYAAQDLLAAVSARERADATASLRLRGHVDAAASAVGGKLDLAGEGAVRLGPDGRPSVRYTQTLTPADGSDARRTGVVVTGGQVYLGPADAAGPWTRVDRSSTDPRQRALATLAANVADNADPTANLARYADAALVADAVDDVVDGVAAVRYTLVVDLTRAAELERDPLVADRLRAQVAGGLTRISSTLWIDGVHRPLRHESRQELPGIGVLALTTDYRDWGGPVTVPAPGSLPVR